MQDRSSEQSGTCSLRHLQAWHVRLASEICILKHGTKTRLYEGFNFRFLIKVFPEIQEPKYIHECMVTQIVKLRYRSRNTIQLQR